ncbi:UDP-glycosyltransferase 92A1 [Camellia lanceoleosa]|nr:UDP-glycosyltransferase 92A1 [Camellia lanceoleosa]
MGLCVGVASGSREVNHKDIVKKIDLVMSGSTKGQDMKNKACEVMEMLNNAKNDEKGFKGSSAKAMEDFLYAALSKSYNVVTQNRIAYENFRIIKTQAKQTIAGVNYLASKKWEVNFGVEFQSGFAGMDFMEGLEVNQVELVRSAVAVEGLEQEADW